MVRRKIFSLILVSEVITPICSIAFCGFTQIFCGLAVGIRAKAETVHCAASPG